MAGKKTKEESYYQITYKNLEEEKVYTLKAREITDSHLGLSFIAISRFLFDDGSVVVNPKDEELRKKFENTKTLHLSIYSILSIEEKGLDNKGLKFKEDRSKLVVLRPDSSS